MKARAAHTSSMALLVAVASSGTASSLCLWAGAASAQDTFGAPNAEPREPAKTTSPSPSATPEAASAETKHGSSVDLEIAANAAYTTAPIRGGTTPFGVGFGGRLGLVFFEGFYAGVRGLYYLGGTDIDISDRSILYGAELGYGFRLELNSSASDPARLTFRPRLGVGGARILHTDPALAKKASGSQPDVVTSASGRSTTPSDTTAVDNVYLEPGVSVMASYGSWFAALTGNALVLPALSYGGAAPATWLSYGSTFEIGVWF